MQSRVRSRQPLPRLDLCAAGLSRAERALLSQGACPDAAPQAVLQVRACPAHGTATDLPRAAYHLGNRHVQLEVQADYLQFEPDPVLADMLRRMHLIVTEMEAPFEPEAGAYGEGGGHGQHHGHDHEHTHEHGH